MDPNSGLAILGAAIGSRKLVEKVLGPTAEYVGAGLRAFAQHRVENVKRIFHKASILLEDNPPAGQAVPPRVLRDVLNDGSYRDDELTAEYYGGILASSRSGIPRDDRGAVFTALLSRLSTYQLRAHYVLYRTVHGLYSKHKDKQQCWTSQVSHVRAGERLFERHATGNGGTGGSFCSPRFFWISSGSTHRPRFLVRSGRRD